MQSKKEERKKFWGRVLPGFTVLALAIIFYFFMYRFASLESGFHNLTGILTPFIYGGIMAYILRMPCSFFEKRLSKWLPRKMKGLAQGLSIFLSVFLALFVVYLLLSLVLPAVVSSISTFITRLPKSLEEFNVWLQTLLEDDEVIRSYVETALNSIETKFQSWAKTDLMPMLENLMGGFTSTVTNVVGTIVNLVIGVIISVYALASRKDFARQGRAVLYSILPEKWVGYILKELAYADKVFRGYFGGQILDSAVVGLTCYVFSRILGFPNAVLVSVIVGVTNIIPYFGPYIGAIPSALLIAMDSPVKAVEFVVFAMILQQIDGNIIAPKLFANGTGLTSFWVLFAITLFGGLFGLVGILIGVPVFAVIYDIIRKLVRLGLRRRGKEEMLDAPGKAQEEKPVKEA